IQTLRRPILAHGPQVVAEQIGRLVKELPGGWDRLIQLLPHSHGLRPLAGEEECDAGHHVSFDLGAACTAGRDSNSCTIDSFNCARTYFAAMPRAFLIARSDELP